MSPTFIVLGCPGAANSFNGTRPSDFSPTSMTAASFSMRTTVPFTTWPSKLSFSPSDSSRSAAKLSMPGGGASVRAVSVEVDAISRVFP